MHRSGSSLRPLVSPVLALALCIAFGAPQAPAQIGGSSGFTEVSSVDATGQIGTAASTLPAISEDGRYVAFVTTSALLPLDTNGSSDVYVHDRSSGAVLLASQTAGGVLGNGPSQRPAISADGRWVAFDSAATSFEGLDANAAADVFLKDMQTGALVRVSNAHLSPWAGNEFSYRPTVSDDGRYVAFESDASDLVPGDTNGFSDVFVRDVQTGQMHLASDGVFGPANGDSYSARISGDGARVAFYSGASNIVLFDSNGASDVFVHTLGGTTVLVSRTPGGTPGNGPSSDPSISADGAWVAFVSWANDLVPGDLNGDQDVFVVEVDTFAVELASLSNQQQQWSKLCTDPAISRDGRRVAFVSGATYAPLSSNMVGNVFVRDLETDRTWSVSRPTGVVGLPNGNSAEPALAQGGAVAAFQSLADNLVPGDSNGLSDVFVRSTIPDPFGYCTAGTTLQGCQPSLSTNGWPSVTPGLFFMLIGADLPNQRNGLIFYGFEGATATPWAGSTMCVAGAKKRTPLLGTLGNPQPADDCSGFFAFDMNGFAAGQLGGNPKPGLALVGQTVNAQFWGRQGPSGTYLSTAIQYVVGP